MKFYYVKFIFHVYLQYQRATGAKHSTAFDTLQQTRETHNCITVTTS